MPKKEINDYIFYKIVCLDNSVDLCYVGSTANWKARNHQHKITCNNENGKLYNSKIYKTIRENGDWTNFKMVQIETREQLTKREAEQIEEQYRVELKANMNGKRCYITEAQKREEYQEYCKKYYENNTDKILEHNQKYYEINRDKINEIKREKVKCECCNLLMRKDSILKHQKSQRHLNNMNNI